MEISRQEMFAKAVHGLARQGWKRAVNNNGTCQYSITKDDGTVCRCAWGYVDPVGTTCNAEGMRVKRLAQKGIGLAKDLSAEDLEFAQRLQAAHDMANDETLGQSMYWFGKHEGLSWPYDLSHPAGVP